MRKQNLNELIEYNDEQLHPKVLINEPGYRMVLVSMRTGQFLPQHATPGTVTVYAMQGHCTFYEGSAPYDLRAGEVASIESGAPHRVEAHEDSVLLVLATGKSGTDQDSSEELDLRQIPPSQRHPLIFQKFDALAIGDSLRLINDHDPVPLSQQIDSMRQGQASWEYIQRGPEIFRIRIRRIASPEATTVPIQAQSIWTLPGIDRK